MTGRVIVGHCLDVLRTLPDSSVQCCVTSPPYWGLRDYGLPPTVWGGEDWCEHEWGEQTYQRRSNDGGEPDRKQPTNAGAIGRDQPIHHAFCQRCGAWRGQLGLEPTPELYVEHLVAVFREVRRVLRPDGTLWLNLGDSYAGANYRGGSVESASAKQASNQGTVGFMRRTALAIPPGLKPKDMAGIPWRVAFALQQPYYTGVIRDERDRYWLAALIDGEGCIGIRRQTSSGNRNPDYADSYIPYLTIKMSDRAPLDRAVSITGYGTVREQAFRMGEDSRKVKTARMPYVWRLDGNKAVQVARELYPYLLIKQPQAAMVHTLDLSNKEKRRGKGNSVPESEMRYRDEIYESIKAFNQRATDQLPSWCKNPQSMTEPGWWLRSAITWCKTSPMPESVRDRPTKATEQVFMLTKSSRYYYDAEAVRDGGHNLWDYWVLGPEPYKDAHFATMPSTLAERCILAGTSAKGCCPTCGAPWERVVEREKIGGEYKVGAKAEGNYGGQGTVSSTLGSTLPHSERAPKVHTLGWQPTCDCDAGEPVPCTVLDCFGGAGTTALAATQNRRDFVIIELNEEYAQMAEERASGVQPRLGL